jgi:anti-anti-sigma factor
MLRIEHDGEGAVVRLPVRFCQPASVSLLPALKKEVTAGATRIVVDFKDTTLIDSTSIGALVGVAGEAKARGIPLYIRNMNRDIHSLFMDTGLDKIFNIESEGRMQAAEVDIFENTAGVPLGITTEIISDACVFHFAGVMNHLQGSRYFKQQFLLAMAQHRKILLDLEELTSFDSLSVSVVLNMNRLIKETGGSMRICNANYMVNDLFKTINLDRIIPVFNSSAEALQDWK